MTDNLDNSSELVGRCLLCGNSFHRELILSLGDIAPCNRFEKQGHEFVETSPLAITQCALCNLVQLSTFPSVEFVRPRVPWIRYKEPDAHLDALVDQLQKLLSLKNMKVIGVGPFDGPLLSRLNKDGLSCKDLDISSRLPNELGYLYLESIQEFLRPDSLVNLATEEGTADIVSCRYLLEHSHDPIASLKGLRHLISPNGCLLIEIPDSKKFLSRMDYSFIWEEHICYFTEHTFRACATMAGYDVAHSFLFPGVLEDALIFILRPQLLLNRENIQISVKKSPDIFLRYRIGFDEFRRKYHSALDRITSTGSKVAIFGAGHQSIMFINALGLERFISCVIDDAPEKFGYLVPGTAIEIVPSDRLFNDLSIEVCLLGVSPVIEEKIRAKYAAYLDRGGKMFSIFPGAGSITLID